MQIKKTLFLFLGLILPLLVFIFLKVFGKNEFEVPLLYDKGVIAIPEGCDKKYATPYRLSDSLINEVYTDSDKALVIVDFSESSIKLAQLVKAFQSQVALIESKNIQTSNERLEAIKKCDLLIQSPNTIVLIDSVNQIRGYYDGTDRDELDRLEAELNIILKKY